MILVDTYYYHGQQNDCTTLIGSIKIRVLLFPPYAFLTRSVKIIKLLSEKLKTGPDYIFWTDSKYKRKFTPHFYSFTFYLLSLSLPLIPNSKPKKSNQNRWNLAQTGRISTLINITWKVSSFSLWIHVICTVFFLLHWCNPENKFLKHPKYVLIVSFVLFCVVCVLQKVHPLLNV